MSDAPKRSVFGRMFGGGKAETPAKAEDQTPPVVPAEETPPPSVDAQEEAPEKTSRFGWFQRLRQGLAKTSSRLTEGITGVFTKRKLDDETLEELEDLLIQADLGLEVASSVTTALRKSRYNSDITSEEVRTILAEEVEKILAPVAEPLEIDASRKPHVVLVVGVNGTGKTTTIGKYANQFTRQGLKVMLAAGDTFRAAAIEQLKIWGERTGAPVVASEPGADAAGLAFDALQRAKKEGYDVLIIDTAGRLQNKTALMAELEKVIRVIRKMERAAPHSVILTLDATTGQNALSQVEIFEKVAGVTGLVMTKLDGTARGGILVAIASKYGLPVHAIGVGEGVGDLQEFQARDFARAIAGIS
jgi:fused signal recognition particle receptor